MFCRYLNTKYEEDKIYWSENVSNEVICLWVDQTKGCMGFTKKDTYKPGVAFEDDCLKETDLYFALSIYGFENSVEIVGGFD